MFLIRDHFQVICARVKTFLNACCLKMFYTLEKPHQNEKMHKIKTSKRMAGMKCLLNLKCGIKFHTLDIL